MWNMNHKGSFQGTYISYEFAEEPSLVLAKPVLIKNFIDVDR